MNFTQAAEMIKFSEIRREFHRKFDLDIEALDLDGRISTNQLEFGRGQNNEGIWSCSIATPTGLKIHRCQIAADVKPYSDEVRDLLVRSFAKAAGYDTDLQDLAALAEEGNRIKLNGFSNPESERLYHAEIKDFTLTSCISCKRFGPLGNEAPWGVCLHSQSKHFTETVLERFTCNCYEGRE
jgi:hypothetical protein